MPLHRQLPKRRGFTSRNPKAVVLNLDELSEKFQNGETVNPKILLNKGLIKSKSDEIKILGQGELKRTLIFEKVSISNLAKEKIIKSGSKISDV